MSRTMGFARGATGGMSRLAAALGSAGRMEQQAFDAESANQSRMQQALMMAQQQALKEREFDAQEAAINQRPGLFMDSIAAQTGSTRPMVEAKLKQIQTGQYPTDPNMVLQGPTPDGEPLMGLMRPQSQDVESAIGRALSQLLPVMNNRAEPSVSEWSQALERLQGVNARGDIMAGGSPLNVGRAYNATAGRGEFQIPNNYLGNEFTGNVDMQQPINAGQQGLVRAQTGAQQANARQSDASAESSRATAAATRAGAADGVNRGGAKAPAGYRWGADGQTLEAIPGGPADPNTKGAKLSKPPTEGQAKAMMFATRMAVSDEVLSELEKSGVSRPGVIKGAAETVGNIMGLGTDSMGGALAEVAGTATNWTQSEKQQQVEQARRDFINAILRRESGAVISLGEFRNAEKQYFPQPGDSPATLRQKAANRKTAIAGMKAEFGEAMLPDFDRVVNESRKARTPAAARVEPEGSWGDDGIKIERIR